MTKLGSNSNTDINTKVFLFTSVGYPAYDEHKLLGTILHNFDKICKLNQYSLEVCLPVKIEVVASIEKRKTVKLFVFCGKEVEIEEKLFSYYLVFPKQLPEQEINLWRMFKIGLRVGQNN